MTRIIDEKIALARRESLAPVALAFLFPFLYVAAKWLISNSAVTLLRFFSLLRRKVAYFQFGGDFRLLLYFFVSFFSRHARFLRESAKFKGSINRPGYARMTIARSAISSDTKNT